MKKIKQILIGIALLLNSLLNGIYYLHIYDGVNATPEIQQIVVQH